MGLKAAVKKNRFVYAAASRLRALPYPFLKQFMRVCHGLRGVEKNKVYFSSFGGKLYNENPKYVCEALVKICPEAKIVFRLNKKGMAQAEIPPQVRRIPQYSPAALFHMATARVIVKNAALKPWMTKFSDQTYIQLWHGDRGLKTILLDKNPNMQLPDRELMDIGVSASRMGSEIYMRRGFGFTGELMEVGYPKNDILIHTPPGLADEVHCELGIDRNVRVLLYAPTFRDRTSGSAQSANFSLKRLQAALEESTGARWLVLTRGHNLNTGVAADAGADVSAYPDVSRLLLACDLLVTDYSSICGDFLLLNRPVILYHADREEYDRGLIFDPEASPYRIAHNEEELLALARESFAPDFDPAANCRELADFYGMTESGHASEAVARRICELLQRG